MGVTISDEDLLKAPGTPSSTLAWILAYGDSGMVARFLATGEEKAVARLKKLIESVPILEDPYSAILDAIRCGGKLQMDDWHRCETSHCTGGWAVHLAGREGHKLERLVGSARAAATLILKKSRPDAELPDFFTSNMEAMKFIRARAKEEVPSCP